MDGKEHKLKGFVKICNKDWYVTYLCFYIIIGGGLACVPLLLLGIYNHPSADDYNYAILTYHSWSENKSILDLIRSAMETDIHYWHSWQGTYSSAFFMSLQPAIFGDNFYFLTSFFMLIIIYGSCIYFTLSILYKKLHAKRIEAVFIGVFVSFVMVQWMPSAVQGIYWYNGSVHYVLFWGLLLCLITRLICIYNMKPKKKLIRNLIFIVLLGTILEGGNQVSALMGLLCVGGLLIFGIMKKNRIYTICSIITLIFMGVGFYFNISSPGTEIRQSYFTKLGVIETMIQSIYNALSYVDSWLNIRSILILVILFPVCYRIMRRFISSSSFEFRYPLLITILSFGWICAMLCPPLYATRFPGEGRLHNIVYFSFVALLVLNEFYYMGWVLRRIDIKEVKVNLHQFLLVIVICFIAISYLKRGTYSSYQAVSELYTGEAIEYDKVMMERHEIIKKFQGTEESVILSPLSVRPNLLFFDDITTDENDWRNRSMAEYYGLKSIKIAE